MRSRDNLKYYFGARITRGKTRRLIYFQADGIRVENGDLLLLRVNDGEEQVYRALARGTWQDVFAASVMSGSEVHEEHDVNAETGAGGPFTRGGI
jgi:hypothetical protein